MDLTNGRKVSAIKNTVHLQEEYVYLESQDDPDNQLPEKWISNVVNF